ncbi:LysR family transcriptional regulator [Uliginosibacterium gangwonense]|uniref:LysR family transcriptional regulator n=1 Tax=Uliginosibacterium gangwonense TaxID=392736 RepID=UPI0003764608|nr:LysR family transcriptional regulator [Uliginosibacterium gangwonense]
MNKLSIGADRLDLLETFVRIVEAGSLSAAAQQQGTTQPTVSRRLQQLERLMGLRLLLRSTHAMNLTEDGERCYEHAKELLERWHAIESDLRGVQDLPRGNLRVLVPSVFGQQQLIPPLIEFLNGHPNVSVEWLLHDRMPDFIAEGIDCAIRIGAVDAPGLIAIRLAELPRIVVAAPSILGDAPLPNDPVALAQLPWIALNTFYRDEVVLHHTQFGEAKRLAIHPRLSTDHLHALCNAVLAGMGVGIASAWAVADALSDGRLIQLAPDWSAPPLPISLVYPPARFRPARLMAFIQVMRDYLPQVPGVRLPSSHHDLN